MSWYVWPRIFSLKIVYSQNHNLYEDKVFNLNAFVCILQHLSISSLLHLVRDSWLNKLDNPKRNVCYSNKRKSLKTIKWNIQDRRICFVVFIFYQFAAGTNRNQFEYNFYTNIVNRIYQTFFKTNYSFSWNISWWQVRPPRSASMPNLSNSPELHLIKKTKTYINPLGNSKASHIYIFRVHQINHKTV